MRRDRRIKAKTIGPPHGLPKRLTFRSGSAFCEGKRKRPSVKVKRLVRPLGDRFPAFWPCLPALPGEGLAFLRCSIQTCSARHREVEPATSEAWWKRSSSAVACAPFPVEFWRVRFWFGKNTTLLRGKKKNCTFAKTKHTMCKPYDQEHTNPSMASESAFALEPVTDAISESVLAEECLSLEESKKLVVDMVHRHYH